MMSRIPRLLALTTSAVALSCASPVAQQATTTGGVTVYTRVDQLEVHDTGRGPAYQMPLKISGSSGLKLAFVARATGGITTVPLNMFDSKAQDNTTALSYAWVGETWRPILYRCDRFRYNGGDLSSIVKPDTAYETLRFHGTPTPGNQGVLSIRNLVIYRGEDVTPPQSPAGLTAAAGADGVHLSWRIPQDDVGVAVYAVSRASGNGSFVKIAETSVPNYVDPSPAAGTNRYRVLASDFQDNLSPWSNVAEAAVSAPAAPAHFTQYEMDRASYAADVRRIHDAGVGKVVKGRVLQFGDSLSGATLYQLNTEAALDRYTVEAQGRAGWTTAQGRTVIEQDLQHYRPEFCFILYGTNNAKDKAAIDRGIDDLQFMTRACAASGAVPLLATIPPRGFTDPRSQPEADFNAALVRAFGGHTPIAYMFEELQRQPDRHRFLAGDGVHWERDAFMIAPRTWQQAMDQVTFALLDRPQ